MSDPNDTTNDIAARVAVYERMEGASRWTKAGRDRIYWNNLCELYGLETTRYNSGRISSARLNGSSISNTLAAKIAGDILGGRFWFDCQTGQFWSSLPADMTSVIKARIRERAAALVANPEA